MATNPLLNPQVLAAAALNINGASQLPPAAPRPLPGPVDDAPKLPALPGTTEMNPPVLDAGSNTTQVKGPSQTDLDQAERSRVINSGSGISQIAKRIEGTGFGQNHPILGKIAGIGAQGLATLGDIGLATALPSVELMTPGTEGHHQMVLNRATSNVNQDLAEEEKKAQTANLDLQPQLKLTQAALAQQKEDEKENHDSAGIAAKLRQLGYDSDGTALPYEQLSVQQQAKHDLMQSQAELADATESLNEAKAKNLPEQMHQAQMRIDNAMKNRQVAQQRLGLDKQKFEFASQGTINGVAPAGTMLDANGNPIGTMNAANVRPTAMERNKADLASSAVDRIGELRGVLERNADIFGPGPGRAMKIQQWLGSQSPDAQTFLSGATYLADHSAAVFGGRSKYVTEQLQKLTDPKSNPEAMKAALDEAERAATGFVKAGTVNTAKKPAAAGGGKTPPASNGGKNNDPLGIR